MSADTTVPQTPDLTSLIAAAAFVSGDRMGETRNDRVDRLVAALRRLGITGELEVMVGSTMLAAERDAYAEHTPVRTVRLEITRRAHRRHGCLCCDREGPKTDIVVGVFDEPDLLQSKYDYQGAICDVCLDGDVRALLAAPPYPCVTDGPIPTLADLLAVRAASGG